MLAGLFEEDDSTNGLLDQKSGNKAATNIKRPPGSRCNTGLCGLNNLGATCYLNSILQTLHFTPEFRETLFDIQEEELGLGQSVASGNVVRAIPLQLQRLFARLLLLNQSSAEVTALTDSFGWTNSEEFQQHDVQELNRILFSAIESSLLGTSGEQLIAKLYHGITVQQITCRECQRVSEREEEFLDLPVALSGHAGLEDALKDSYIQLEQLNGSNQYQCSNCCKLVDATRGCHIRKLPSILTFALLRFLYDFKKGERYKDTSKFKFPMVLDMSAYCEEVGHVREDSRYELFSVIIHSGSTHSGHYTAYIRDVDALGCWSYPDEEPVQLPASVDSTDLIDYENPADLLCALLEQLGGTASVSKLCKSLQDQTGVTWNKRFKKQFGAITTFMKSCNQVFSMSDSNQISLKQPPGNGTGRKVGEDSTSSSSQKPHPVSTPENGTTSHFEGSRGIEGAVAEVDALSGSPAQMGEGPRSEAVKEEEDAELEVGGAPVKDLRPAPVAGQCWFEFNDTHVSPISPQAIEKMFQGKKSAYMIFYRKVSTSRPTAAQGIPPYRVPERLLVEVAKENERLEKERLDYEVAINTVRLYIHVHSGYHLYKGALYKKQEGETMSVEIDKRKTVEDLKDILKERLQGSDSGMVMHTAKFLPAGLHLYDIISDKDGASLAALDISNDTHIFLWDGVQVDGVSIQVGEASEPVQLLVTYPMRGVVKGVGRNSDSEEERSEVWGEEVAMSFPKDCTLGEVRVTLSNLLAVQPNQVTISQVKVQGRRGQSQSSVVVLTSGKDKSTLSQLSLTDGDKLTVEREVKKGVQTLAHSVADKQNKKISFIIEDRVMGVQDSSSYPVCSMEIGKDESVAVLKKRILQQHSLTEEVRFRVESDECEVGPPLYESQTLEEAGIGQGQKVILERGRPPFPSQMCLQCSVSVGVAVGLREVMVDKSLSIGECCRVMALTLGLEGDDWHLRKTNWCGEEAEILEDETATLEDEKLKHGELLLVEAGRLPPKGFIRLSVYLLTQDGGPSFPHASMASQGLVTAEDHTHVPDSDRMSGIAEEAETNVPLHQVTPSKYYPLLPGNLVALGSVEMNRDCTVEELKENIVTLPALSGAVIPTLDFVRLRELIKGRLGRVFKVNSHSLRRLKFTSDTQVCCQILHYEEKLKQSSLLLFVCMRVPGERQYGPLTEVTYDTERTPKSCSPHSLRVFLSDVLQVPLDHLLVAKHKVEMFEWLLIEDSWVHKKGKKKGRSQANANIKNSPLMLHDGDIIGCKDMRQCMDDNDFTTPDDDSGKAILLAIQEDKRKRRKAKENFDMFGPKEKRQRRPERGIKIYVPDFRAK